MLVWLGVALLFTNMCVIVCELLNDVVWCVFVCVKTVCFVVIPGLMLYGCDCMCVRVCARVCC